MDEVTIDLIYSIAKRVRELGNKKIDHLRMDNGCDCDTPGDAIRKDRGKTRGQIMEEIIIAEYLD